MLNDCGIIGLLNNGRAVTSQWIGEDYEKKIPNRNPFPENLKKVKIEIVREAINAIESAKEARPLRSLETE